MTIKTYNKHHLLVAIDSQAAQNLLVDLLVGNILHRPPGDQMEDLQDAVQPATGH